MFHCLSVLCCLCSLLSSGCIVPLLSCFALSLCCPFLPCCLVPNLSFCCRIPPVCSCCLVLYCHLASLPLQTFYCLVLMLSCPSFVLLLPLALYCALVALFLGCPLLLHPLLSSSWLVLLLSSCCLSLCYRVSLSLCRCAAVSPGLPDSIPVWH